MTDPAERTQRLDQPDPPPERVEQPISYTEDYGDAAQRERTLIDSGPAPAPASAPTGGLADAPGGDGDRTWSTTMLVLISIITLLVGFILALLVLPEEEPAVLDTALADQNTQLRADNAALTDQLAASQQQLDAANAELEALRAADQESAASNQALAEREAQLNAREAELDARESAVAEREVAVEQREQQQAGQEADGGEAGADGGVNLPDLGEVELPQIDGEQARGAFERLVERLQELFGIQ